jgi:hypothetical protein
MTLQFSYHTHENFHIKCTIDISMISDSREVEKGGCDHPVQVNQYINEL